MKSLHRIGVVAAVWTAFCLTAAAREPASRIADADSGRSFAGEVEVRVVTLNVSVVDADGEPVRGLERDDFRVFVDGEEREITNFLAEAPDATRDAPGREEARPHVVLLFDTNSLETSNRERAVDEVARYLQNELEPSVRVMVVVSSPGLRVLCPFTTDHDRIRTALDDVARSDVSGDVDLTGERTLRSSILSRRTYRGDWRLHADLVAQVESAAARERDRVVLALAGVDWVLRGLAGVGGRKDVIWIGQDLVMRPGIDLYELLYEQVEAGAHEAPSAISVEREQRGAELSRLDRPEVWAATVDLGDQFETVAGIAQATGTSVHVLDVTDRDRDTSIADAGLGIASRPMALSSSRGGGAAGGYSLSRRFASTDGALLLATATGGSFFGGSRDLARHLDRFDAQLEGRYSIGYRPAGDLDASMHQVEVRVTGPASWRVRHHQRVAALSPYHRLANRAFSRLLIGEGDNPLGIRVERGEKPPQEVGEGEIHEYRVVAPLDLLTLELDGDSLEADLAVAVVAAEGDGNVSDPKLFRLPLEVPADQASGGRSAASTFRLVLEPGTRALAVAVRDERSGAVSSVTVPLG